MWVSSNLTSDKQVTEQCTEANKLLGLMRRAVLVHPKHPNVSYTLSFYRPVPSRLRNPSMVATVHWLTKASWKRAAPCNKTSFEASFPLRCNQQDPPPTNKSVTYLILAWIFGYSRFLGYKVVNNLVFIDSEALPATRQSTRSTRSSSSNAITYIPKRSRTVTYQRSFFIRACRTWNVLPAELRTSHISLASFKRSLLQYYNKALDLYDVDDIRTWTTICPRCNIARTLLCPPMLLLAIRTSVLFPFDHQ